MRRTRAAKKKARAIFLGALLVLALIFLLRRENSTEAQKISIIPRESSSVYWVKFRLGAKEACEREGLELLWCGSEVESDGLAQIHAVQQALGQDVSGIVLAPSNSKTLADSIDKICKEKIPLVLVDSDISQKQNPCLLTVDSKKGGQLAALRFGEILGGCGKVVVIRWTRDSPLSNARTVAFKDTIAKDYPDMELIESEYCEAASLDKVRGLVENMLNEHADVDGVFACNATTAAGVLQVLRKPEYARRNIRMIGFDPWPMLVAALDNHEIEALIVCDPRKLGNEVIEAIASILRGEKNPKEIDACVELVTAERLAEPQIRVLMDLP